MSPPPARPSPAPRDEGFVLIAVAGLVLALFFLVFFLYALSSWDSQFLQKSVDGEQAFQSALGGIERARFLLCSVGTFQLENVSGAAWPESTHVVAASAVQDGNATGPVDWTGAKPVAIRVTADVRGERRTVEGDFTPGQGKSPYHHLITSSDRFFLDTGSANDRSQTVGLTGAVWQGAPEPVWTWMAWLLTASTVTPSFGPVPTPDLGSYFALHPAEDAKPVRPTTGGVYHLQDGSASAPCYYSGPGAPDEFSVVPDGQANVSGLAVWLFPGGVRFDNQFSINAPQNLAGGCLVIVAGPAGAANDPEYPDAGIRFRNGLTATSIPVILVSSGTVVVEEEDDALAQNDVVSDVAIYARDVVVAGPRRATGHTLLLNHAVTGSNTLDGFYVYKLASQNALPNAASALHTLDLAGGTWRVSNP